MFGCLEASSRRQTFTGKHLRRSAIDKNLLALIPPDYRPSQMLPNVSMDWKRSKGIFILINDKKIANGSISFHYSNCPLDWRPRMPTGPRNKWRINIKIKENPLWQLLYPIVLKRREYFGPSMEIKWHHTFLPSKPPPPQWPQQSLSVTDWVFCKFYIDMNDDGVSFLLATTFFNWNLWQNNQISL